MIGGAESRRLGVERDLDALPKDVGEALQEPAIAGHAAIHAKDWRKRYAAHRHVAAHGREEIARLKGDRL